jgi:hypothetical protein
MLDHISAPQPIRPIGDEAALHQIEVRGRRRPLTASVVSVASDAGPAGDPQQPRDPLAPDVHPRAQAQLRMHP